MYFPTLKDIELKYNISSEVIKKFDTWLGIRRSATKKYLNPFQFALDTDIDENYAFDLFELSTDKEFNILSMRYVVLYDEKIDYQETFTNIEDIPDTIRLQDEILEINDSMVRIWFSLEALPSHPPVLTELKGGKSGHVHGNITLPTRAITRRKNTLRRGRR